MQTVKIEDIVEWVHYIDNFTNGKGVRLTGIRSYPVVKGKDRDYYKHSREIIYRIGSFVTPELIFNHPDPKDGGTKNYDSGTLSYLIDDSPEAKKVFLSLHQGLRKFMLENMNDIAYYSDEDPRFKRVMRDVMEETYKDHINVKRNVALTEEQMAGAREFIVERYYKGPVYTSNKGVNVVHLTYSKSAINSDFRMNDKNERIKTLRVPVIYFDPDTKEKREIDYKSDNSENSLGQRFHGVVGFTIGPLYFGGTTKESFRMVLRVTNIIRLPNQERQPLSLCLDDLADEYDSIKKRKRGDVDIEEKQNDKEGVMKEKDSNNQDEVEKKESNNVEDEVLHDMDDFIMNEMDNFEIQQSKKVKML